MGYYSTKIIQEEITMSKKAFIRFTIVLLVIGALFTAVFMGIRNNQQNIVDTMVSSIEDIMGVECKETPVPEVSVAEDEMMAIDIED